MKFRYLILSTIFSLVHLGCSESGKVDGVSSGTNSAQSASENTCASPATRVIYTGDRSLTVSPSVRGLYSDTRMNPSSGYPSVAYTDVGCTCLKYTFWNGVRWITEVITAGNSTNYTYLRLRFLSDGTPIVAWSNTTTTLQIAIRSTSSLTASATWTLRVLDSGGTTIRPVEMSVSPSDQVALLYSRNTAGTTHVIFCSSSCNQVLNYSAPSTTLGTSGTTPAQYGVDWCNTGTGYYPVVAFSQAAQAVFAVCRQTNLSTCLGGIASWGSGAVFNLTSSGANRPVISLIMDRSTADAPIRAAVNDGSTGIRMYQSSFAGGGCASGTLAAIASGATLAGSTTFGAGYLAMERADSGVYHMAANDAAARTRYFNSVGTTFLTMNAAGTVSSSATAAAGAHRAGFALDVANSQAYFTFARTSIATPQTGNGNLMFAFVENTTVASNNASAEFYEFPLTLDGQIQSLTNQVPNVALAVTSSSVPAVAVVDYSAAATTAGILKYGYRTGTSATSLWSFMTVPLVAQPQNVALAFDQNDKPWIAIFDQQTLRFLLLTNSSTDGTGTWSTYYFPLRVAVSAATAPAFHSVALAMDTSTASSIRPVMIVGVANHGTLANTGVWSAKLNPTNSNWSNITQVVSTNAANSISNVTADYSGTNIVVGYFNRGTNNRVEYSQSTDSGVTYSAVTPVSGLSASGQGLSIQLNPSTARPAMTYYDKTNNRVYMSRCDTAIATCTSLTNWTTTLVDNLSAGTSTLGATSDGLLGTGLSFSSSGAAYVVFPIGSGNTGSLNINSNGSGSFSNTSTTLLTGKSANTIDNPTVSAINFGQAGWNVQSRRAANGALFNVYNGPGNWLYSTSCE